MSKRTPLRILGCFAIGALSTSAVLMGGNAYAFSLSPEEIIKKFMKLIVQYVAGDAYQKFEEMMRDFQDKLSKLYGPESEDKTVEIVAGSQGATKAIEVEQTIYNQQAMSDALDIRTGCKVPTGPIVDDANNQINDMNVTMQETAATSSVDNINRNTFKTRAINNVRQIIESGAALPPAMDGANFLTDEGYLTAQDAQVALAYLRNITDYKRADVISRIIDSGVSNPSIDESIESEMSSLAEQMNATAILNELYLSRVRDRGIAQRLIANTTDIEASILKIHSNDAGMSLIDLYNYEAEAAAFNFEYVKDILTSKLSDDQELVEAIPSSVRAYKYAMQMKSVEDAFLARLYDQQTKINKLNAIIAKQLARANI